MKPENVKLQRVRSPLGMPEPDPMRERFDALAACRLSSVLAACNRGVRHGNGQARPVQWELREANTHD
jgi:hypothetical protein